MPRHLTIENEDDVKEMIGLEPSQTAIPSDTPIVSPDQAQGLFLHSLTREEYRKSARFTSTNAISVIGSVRSTTGYIQIVNCNGARTTLGTGNSESDISVNFGTPPAGYNNLLPKFYAIFPSNSSGVVQVGEDLTFLTLGNNKLTSFSGDFPLLTFLDLNSNQLTRFSGDFPLLTFLGLNNNPLTSFFGNFPLLTYLDLNGTQIKAIDFSGFSSILGVDAIDVQNLTSVIGMGDVLTWHKYQVSEYCLDISGGGLNAAALNALYESLPLESDLVNDNSPYGGPDINVTGNPGAVPGSGSDPTIATAKGWVIIGDSI